MFKFKYFGNGLLVSGCDTDIVLWNMTSFAQIGPWTGSITDKTLGIDVIDDEHVVTASYDGYVRVWHVMSGKEVFSF